MAKSEKPQYATQRKALIQKLKTEAKETSMWTGKNEFSQKVMKAMEKVPRHEFIPDDRKNLSYDNRPVYIGHGQTISQPYIVALMTDTLKLKKTDKVLEVGTGSGYQAAILSVLVTKVVSIEIIPALYKRATKVLRKLNYKNVFTLKGDGYIGYEKEAPYDAIIVTAAAPHVPPKLIEQLKPGGKLVLPVGKPNQTQKLILITKSKKKDKNKQYKITTKDILPVIFVPLTGDH